MRKNRKKDFSESEFEPFTVVFSKEGGNALGCTVCGAENSSARFFLDKIAGSRVFHCRNCNAIIGSGLGARIWNFICYCSARDAKV